MSAVAREAHDLAPLESHRRGRTPDDADALRVGIRSRSRRRARRRCGRETLRCDSRRPRSPTAPVEFQRPDGSSVFRARSGVASTGRSSCSTRSPACSSVRATDLRRPNASQSVIRICAPATSTGWKRARRRPGRGARHDRRTPGASSICSSAPAGTGKTTAMRALRRLGGRLRQRSVVGLAPSAGAAHVLAEDLGIATENTAKWWTNHLVHGETFRRGQLVIIDEASLAGTALAGSHHEPGRGCRRQGAARRRPRPTAGRRRRRRLRPSRP